MCRPQVEACRRALVLLSAIGLVAPSSMHAGGAEPAPGLAVADGEGSQTVPKIRPAPDGGHYVSWYDGAAGYDVRLQRLDPLGLETWPHNGVLVADLGLSWVQDYGLDVDPQGNAIVAFIDDRSGSEQVTATLVRGDGTLLWGAEGIRLTQVPTDTFLGAPEAAATADGRYVIAWSQGAETHLRSLDAEGGLSWDADVVISNPGPAEDHVSDLVSAGGGDVIVSFIREKFPEYRHLYAQKLDPGGKLLWGESHAAIFESGSLQMGNYPDFIPDGQGGAVFAWYEAADVLQCYVQRVLSDGREAFPHNGMAVSTTLGQQRVSPSALFLPITEETIVFWVEEDMGQVLQGVSGQKIGPDGARLWGDGGLAFAAIGSRECSQVCAVPRGDGACCFFVETAGPGSCRLLGTRVDGSGAFVSSPEIFEVSAEPSQKSRLAATCGSGEVPVLVWVDERAGSEDVYVRRLPEEEPQFVRGDSNADGKSDLTDAVFLLNFLFVGGSPPPCAKSADADDGGELQITDAIYLLGYLFLGAPAPPPPSPACGLDPTADGLTCSAFAPCG